MARKEDDRLQLRLGNKLINQGLRAPCRVNIEVHNGTITLNGIVQFDYQKRSAIQAARSMDGAKGVIDRLKVETPTRSWDDLENRPPPAPEAPPAAESTEGP